MEEEEGGCVFGGGHLPGGPDTGRPQQRPGDRLQAVIEPAIAAVVGLHRKDRHQPGSDGDRGEGRRDENDGNLEQGPGRHANHSGASIATTR